MGKFKEKGWLAVQNYQEGIANGPSIIVRNDGTRELGSYEKGQLVGKVI